MTYETALAWLFARTRAGDVRSGIRTLALLEQFNHPQRAFKTIHVIGTNGKGSTCAMLSAGLEQAGVRVGRFTSPHLQNYRERIVVNGQMIDEQSVLEFVAWAQTHTTDAAFFDLTLVLALEYFRRQAVEIAVIEAGVGARHDATSSIEQVQATIITNIDYDHEATIGIGDYPTVLENIAWEKSGGIRAGGVVLTAARGAAFEVIRAVVEGKNAVLYELPPLLPPPAATPSCSKDSTCLDPIHAPDGRGRYRATRASLRGLETSALGLFDLPHAPAMQGAHQLENAALAVATLRLLGYDEKAVRAALQATWAGRLETIWHGQSEIILDGAHNPAGAHALAQSLAGQKFVLIFAAMSRKRVPEILEPLLPLATELHFVSVHPQGVSPLELAAGFGGTAHSSLEAAMQAGLAHPKVLIAGSLYLVGAARTLLAQLQ